MDALEYLKAKGEAHCEQVAKRAGSSLGYFKQIAYRHRRPSVTLAKKLQLESGNELDATQMLFADLKKPVANGEAA